VNGFVVPDKIAPEIGWRVWLVVAHEPARLALHSVVQAKVEWPVRRELRAECRRAAVPEATLRALTGSVAAASHRAPNESCAAGGGHGCGIYAARSPEGCSEYLKGSYSPSLVCGAQVVHRVLGSVALWGKVVAGERGWRAECAYPVEIWLPRTMHIASGRDTGAFRPPVLPRELIAELLSPYAVPVHLLPDDTRALAA
jgi:hypothetical protein